MAIIRPRAGLLQRWVRRAPLLPSLLVLASCGDSSDTTAVPAALESSSPVQPDTVTIDGVLTMRHGADAFARAPQYSIDTVPLTRVDGGDRTDFDLTQVRTVVPLSDGRFVALRSLGGGWLMLFGTDGAPQRILARTGEGPGELMRAAGPFLLDGDTIVVIEDAHKRVNRYHPDSGLIAESSVNSAAMVYCYRPTGPMAGDRVLGVYGCSSQWGTDSAYRLPAAVIVTTFDFGVVDTILVASGAEMVPLKTRYRGRKETHDTWLRFGRTALVAPWGDHVAVATGEDGYRIDRRTLSGDLAAQVVVAQPRRAVTAAMREAEIERELARINGAQSEPLVDIEESRRVAREQPFADSLPPYGVLLPGSGGSLWVTDYATPPDSSVSVTQFDPDGAILARLLIPSAGQPVWFGPDRVIVREVDADGVVRFGMYRIVRR